MTNLDNLIDQARSLRKQLIDWDCLENRCLDGDAFIDAALKHSGADRNDLLRLKARLNENGNDPVRRFVSQAARELRTPNYPSPPKDMPKLVRVFGDEIVEARIAQLGYRSEDLAALACWVAVEKFPNDFAGGVKFPKDRAKEVESARKNLDDIFSQMKSAVTMDDLVSVNNTLVFRRAQSINPAEPHWERRLVDEVERILAEYPHKIESLQSQLNDVDDLFPEDHFHDYAIRPGGPTLQEFEDEQVRRMNLRSELEDLQSQLSCTELSQTIQSTEDMDDEIAGSTDFIGEKSPDPNLVREGATA